MQSVVERDSLGRLVSGHSMPTEWRDKISKATKGENNPFYGKKHTRETKKRIKEMRARQDMSWRKGVPLPDEVREKISSTKIKANLRGEKHGNWKGGCESFKKQQRKIMDDFTCCVCGLRDEDIVQADHIKPKSLAPELSADINNLQTICPNCHARKSLLEIKERVKCKI